MYSQEQRSEAVRLFTGSSKTKRDNKCSRLYNAFKE